MSMFTHNALTVDKKKYQTDVILFSEYNSDSINELIQMNGNYITETNDRSISQTLQHIPTLIHTP